MASPLINPSNYVTFQGISLSRVFLSISKDGPMILLCSVIFNDEVRECRESSSACHMAGTQQVVAVTLSNWFYSEWAVTSVWAGARVQPWTCLWNRHTQRPSSSSTCNYRNGQWLGAKDIYQNSKCSEWFLYHGHQHPPPLLWVPLENQLSPIFSSWL